MESYEWNIYIKSNSKGGQRWLLYDSDTALDQAISIAAKAAQAYWDIRVVLEPKNKPTVR